MKQPISCIIVDDEHLALEGLKKLMQEQDNIELLAACSDGLEAIQKIKEFKPQLLILDIEMPRINGFDILKNIPYQPTAIIFITAHDQYAVEAFEHHAIDYLLKPYSDQRLSKALNKAMEIIALKRPSQKLQSLLADQKLQSKDTVIKEASSDQIILKIDGKLIFLQPSEIYWIEGFDYYIKVHVQHQFYIVRESLKKMLNRLPDHFIRAHKSAIVNTQYVKEIRKTDMDILLTNNAILPMGRAYKADLLSRF